MNADIMVEMRRARRLGMNPWKPSTKPKGSSK
ncbi:hypothetical protein [Mycobacterium phage C3]|nr:hypothetical protein [Mycobacterium phage C3]